MNPLDQSQIQRDSGLPPLDEAHVLARHAVLRCNLFPWAGGNADGFNDLVGVFGVPVRFASRNSFGVSAAPVGITPLTRSTSLAAPVGDVVGLRALENVGRLATRWEITGVKRAGHGPAPIRDQIGDPMRTFHLAAQPELPVARLRPGTAPRRAVAFRPLPRRLVNVRPKSRKFFRRECDSRIDSHRVLQSRIRGQGRSALATSFGSPCF